MTDNNSTAIAIKRTATGLVDALFDSIDKLNAKEIEPEHARAISHTAKAIVGIASLELQARKMNESAVTKTTLKSLVLDGAST